MTNVLAGSANFSPQSVWQQWVIYGRSREKTCSGWSQHKHSPLWCCDPEKRSNPISERALFALVWMEKPSVRETPNYLVWYFCCHPLGDNHNGPSFPQSLSPSAQTSRSKPFFGITGIVWDKCVKTERLSCPLCTDVSCVIYQQSPHWGRPPKWKFVTESEHFSPDTQPATMVS